MLASGMTGDEILNEYPFLEKDDFPAVYAYASQVGQARLPDLSVKEILISAIGWKTPDDFYCALLAALGAPPWHGHSLDALWDSITGGDINSMNPPFVVGITAVDQLNEECKQAIERFATLIGEARAGGVPVDIKCDP
jgi:hypothetical protein